MAASFDDEKLTEPQTKLGVIELVAEHGAQLSARTDQRDHSEELGV